MAKVKSPKSQSIKDAAKEAYLKKHTKSEMYDQVDRIIANEGETFKELIRLKNELGQSSTILEKYKKDASNWRVKCNELTLENVSLTIALNDTKHQIKVYGSIIIGLLTGFSLLIIFY
jgi:hypothetical protein